MDLDGAEKTPIRKSEKFSLQDYTPTECHGDLLRHPHRLKRGVFHSVVDLQAAINRYIDETNHHPKPFVWTADPNKIIAARQRGVDVLDSIH